MLMKFKVRRGCTFPSPLTRPSTKIPNGEEEFVMTSSVNGCSILPETQFVGTHLRVDSTRVLSVGVSSRLRKLPKRDQSLTSNHL